IVEHISTDAVAIGTKVTLLDMEFDEETVYKIASNASGNDDDDIITPDSPVGKAIIGKKVGEVAQVVTPSKHTYEVKVVNISK
ncbi:MAG: GreA/GreB family elongation factor, partial [Oscillospiraceae bacterium]|nr:GreA/GreB family elongation factor [Oscillospiraceae bacterium]